MTGPLGLLLLLLLHLRNVGRIEAMKCELSYTQFSTYEQPELTPVLLSFFIHHRPDALPDLQRMNVQCIDYVQRILQSALADSSKFVSLEGLSLVRKQPLSVLFLFEQSLIVVINCSFSCGVSGGQ